MKKLLILCCLFTACTSQKPCYYMSMPAEVEEAMLNYFEFRRELSLICQFPNTCSEDEIAELSQKHHQTAPIYLSSQIQMLPY